MSSCSETHRGRLPGAGLQYIPPGWSILYLVWCCQPFYTKGKSRLDNTKFYMNLTVQVVYKLRMFQVQPKTACGHFCGKGLIFHIDDMFSMPTIPCRYLWERSQTTLTRQGRWVVHAGNVNGMQIFPYNSKGIPSQMSTRGG